MCSDTDLPCLLSWSSHTHTPCTIWPTQTHHPEPSRRTATRGWPTSSTTSQQRRHDEEREGARSVRYKSNGKRPVCRRAVVLFLFFLFFFSSFKMYILVFVHQVLAVFLPRQIEPPPFHCPSALLGCEPALLLFFSAPWFLACLPPSFLHVRWKRIVRRSRLARKMRTASIRIPITHSVLASASVVSQTNPMMPISKYSRLARPHD